MSAAGDDGRSQLSGSDVRTAAAELFLHAVNHPVDHGSCAQDSTCLFTPMLTAW